MEQVRKPSARSQGFTLIELLVVVAIIAILLSVLLPALSGVRSQARATVCATHLADVGKAFQIYLADNNAVYPPSYIYATGEDGRYDIYDQPSTADEFGYLHWSWFLYNSGEVKDDLFTCPDFEDGGCPRTNPGPEARDWEPQQKDDRGNRDPNPFIDRQAPRVAYTANAAIVPRNKFTDNMVAGQVRRNVFVNETDVIDPRAVILATEFANDWRKIAKGDSGDAFLLSKSHRPITPFYGLSASWNEYAEPINPSVEKRFTYGDPSVEEYGLLSVTDLQDKTGIITAEDSGIAEFNAVGRHHPGGDKWGGTANFLFIDGHVERITVLETLEKRYWGARYYSLEGPDTGVLYDEELAGGIGG